MNNTTFDLNSLDVRSADVNTGGEGKALEASATIYPLTPWIISLISMK